MATEINKSKLMKDIENLKGLGENRRQYFRLETSRALCAYLSIYSVGGKLIKGSSTKVCIENISAGGMGLVTDLDLPLVANYTLLLEFKLLDTNFEIESVIVRKTDYERYGNLYEYGLTFVLDNNQRDELVKILNKLHISIVKTKAPYNKCSLCDQKLEKGCFRK